MARTSLINQSQHGSKQQQRCYSLRTNADAVRHYHCYWLETVQTTLTILSPDSSGFTL